MSRTHVGIVGLLLAGLCVPALWVLADDDNPRPIAKTDARADSEDVSRDDRPRSDKRRTDDRPRRQSRRADDRPTDVDPPRDNDEPADDRPQGEAFLGKTVRLNFTIVGDDEERSFVVLCARREFRISHDESGPEFEHSLKITGQLQRVDARGRVFLAFEAMTHHHDRNEDFQGVFSSEGSAIVKFGEKTTLANLGDQPLTVTATIED